MTDRTEAALPANLTHEDRAELEAGVTQARLAALAGCSPSTLRSYEARGLVPTVERDGRKLYGPESLAAALQAREARSARRADEPAAVPPVLPSPEEIASLRERIETGRRQLADKVRELEARRATIGAARQELEDAVAVRADTRRRALDVTSRATAVRDRLGRLITEKPAPKSSILRFDAPRAKTKKN